MNFADGAASSADWAGGVLGGTGRMQFDPVEEHSAIRLVFSNTSQLANGANAITVAAGIDLVTVQLGVTYLGASSWTIAPGQVIVTDPLPITVSKGGYLFVQTYVTVTAGQTFPIATYAVENLPSYSVNAGFPVTYGANYAVPAGANTTLSSAYPTITGSRTYNCDAVLGLTTSSRNAIVQFGDSTDTGYGDTAIAAGDYQGWICRWLQYQYPLVRVCRFGSQGSDFVLTSRSSSVSARWGSACLPYVQSAIWGWGRNDLSGGATLAQLQAWMILGWKLLSGYGLFVVGTTITPISTSTDAWATVGNQTTDATNTIRVQYNAWMLDGAPLDPTTRTPVAVGTVPALRAGRSPLHPLGATIDKSTAVETALGSGIWKAPGYTADGEHPTAAGYAAIAAALPAPASLFGPASTY